MQNYHVGGPAMDSRRLDSKPPHSSSLHLRLDSNPSVNTPRRAQPSSNRDLVSRLAEHILAKRLVDGKKGFIVGIDGKGCSGKSILSGSLVDELRRLGVACISASIDDFCNPRAIRYARDVPEALQVYHKNFDEQKWIEQVIRPFHSEGKLRFDEILLDATSDTYTSRVRLDLHLDGILIAEGLHLYKRAYHDLYNYAILLHITDEIQLARALVRDSRDRGKPEEEIRYKYANRFVPSFKHYLREDRPCEIADAVIDYQIPDCPIMLEEQNAKEIACEP